jgi:large subunit ribosomal protein L21
MHAVIVTGGKQYRVKANEIIEIESIKGDIGEKIEFSKVLAIIGESKDIKVGSPVVEGAKVEGEIINHFRGEKVVAFKMKRRKGYRRKVGHRQNLTKVKISSIEI